MESLVKVRFAAAALSLLTLVATNPALGQAGSLDPTFGSGGIVITNFGVNENNFQFVDAALAPNGDIVVAGTVSMAADGVANSNDIIRYLPSGALDPSFGTGGIETLSAPYFASTSGVLSVQSNGQILILTQVEVNGTLEVALERLNTNGQLDPTFGSAGIVITNFPAPADEAASPNLVLAQPDGKILLAGEATPDFRSKATPETILARYLSNGALDTTFGSGGIVTATAIGTPSTLALLSGDGILVSSGGEPEQFTSTGTLLGTPTGGTVIAVKVTGATTFQPNADFLITGAVRGPFGKTNDDSIIERFLVNGTADSTFASPDISFGPNGVEVDSLAFAIAVDSQGRVIVGGIYESPSSDPWGLARVNSNGALDTTFGSGGTVTTPVGLEGFISLLLIQPNNEIVAVGEAQVSKNTDSTMEDLALARYTAQ
jgi:uncharacterized delta-60 repeat protein